ncbi:hypothetical protein [Crassaminicella profunda]|uniref:hypothetical protein n=1 Tax=Crassaminicella profunda TaxID=1286698 RepID=UPI001CA7B0F2|nr:hypothetical protein [Crassaminicella profunda]QZY55775.1 hypothetical protein K7H06_01785 [Crassaminicella profunda]
MKKRRKSVLLLMSTCVGLLLFSYVAIAMGTEPGSEEDPIVTKGYVERRHQQLKYYIDEKIKELAGNSNTSSTQGTVQGPVFEIVEVQKGQRIIGGASTEMIIRSGQVAAIASASGGIADLISGKDLKSGEIVPLNHLLLLPRGDGRGVAVLMDKTYILIKGSYEIQ